MRVLIADDEMNIRDSIVRYLKLEGIEGIPAENGLSAKRLFETEPFDAAVIDLRMPGMDGISLLRWLKNDRPLLPVIMISAYGEVRDAVEAMKQGAGDYIVKPFDPEELILRIKRLVEDQRRHDSFLAGQSIAEKNDMWVSESPVYKKINKLIEKVSASDSIVLVTGESGTGKEVTAQAIHRLSSRASHPFIPINIGGVPETLLESELFGYEKGAFTGASSRKIGMFELASSGTLFLDEIGDMPIHLQVKLLRFLQEKIIRRLGGTEPIPLDVRIICATNRNLKTLIDEGRFREDLFFRLNVVSIHLPPLRDRKEDIPKLTGFFIERFNRTMRGAENKIGGITPEALRLLNDYSFPGNIRELENLVERAFILSEADILTVKDFDLPQEAKVVSSPAGTLQEMEKKAILAALHRWEGNRTKTAIELGITRRTLFNKIREYGLREDGESSRV
ncbi:MAG: sigma-54-dependent Fis family transcriptional regulator [Spirochaetales bacterium]|nr:sigma-54-dependent Fis family transcriptional regulator [Spirochaetales bacterium]